MRMTIHITRGLHSLLEMHLDGIHIFNIEIFNGVHGLQPVAVPHQGHRLLPGNV